MAQARPGSREPGVAAHASTWGALGGFDDDFFMYWEDVDLSFRAAVVADGVDVLSTAEVKHAVGLARRVRPRASRPCTSGTTAAADWFLRASTIRRPELVADAPVTICRNNGRNDVAPNITAPSRKLIAKHTAATELPNSLSGRIGSCTRRSWTTNATVKIDGR